MLDYVLSDGHRDQMMIVTKMYRDLMAHKKITTQNIKQSHLLGWCMELVSLRSIEFFFFIFLDIKYIFYLYDLTHGPFARISIQ